MQRLTLRSLSVSRNATPYHAPIFLAQSKGKCSLLARSAMVEEERRFRCGRFVQIVAIAILLTCTTLHQATTQKKASRLRS